MFVCLVQSVHHQAVERERSKLVVANNGGSKLCRQL